MINTTSCLQIEEAGHNEDGSCKKPFDYLTVNDYYQCRATPGQNETYDVEGVAAVPMRFISDESNTRKGFKIKFEFY